MPSFFAWVACCAIGAADPGAAAGEYIRNSALFVGRAVAFIVQIEDWYAGSRRNATLIVNQQSYAHSLGLVVHKRARRCVGLAQPLGGAQRVSTGRLDVPPMTAAKVFPALPAADKSMDSTRSHE